MIKCVKYPFHRIDVDVGEEQLVTVTVLSLPVSNHLSDARKVANET